MNADPDDEASLDTAKLVARVKREDAVAWRVRERAMGPLRGSARVRTYGPSSWIMFKED